MIEMPKTKASLMCLRFKNRHKGRMGFSKTMGKQFRCHGSNEGLAFNVIKIAEFMHQLQLVESMEEINSIAVLKQVQIQQHGVEAKCCTNAM